MNYQKYIISFVPGSSGRFVSRVLDRLILQSTTPITISDVNSVHSDIRDYTGISMININDPDVFDRLYFDPPGKGPENYGPSSSILATHVYPDFDKINEKYQDVGVILIRVKPEDLKEVVFNSALKNENLMLDTRTLLNKVVVYNRQNYLFLKDDFYPANCLILDYPEIYNKLKLLKKLMDFTGIDTVPDGLYDSCERYIANRTIIVNQNSLR